MDLLQYVPGFVDGFINGFGKRADAKDPSSVRYYLSLFHPRPGMKDQAVFRLWFFQPRDREPLLITAWIAAADSDNSTADAGVHLYYHLIEPLFRHRCEKRHQVILQPGHDHFCLRIAHPAIIFNDIRLLDHLDKYDK